MIIYINYNIYIYDIYDLDVSEQNIVSKKDSYGTKNSSQYLIEYNR